MMTRISLLLPLLLFLPVSASAFSKDRPIGTLNEAIAAAKNGVEPAYIGPLMELFTDKLTAFTRLKRLDSERKELALLPAVAAVIDVMLTHTRDVAATLPNAYAVWEISRSVSWGVAGNVLYKASKAAAFFSTPNARYPVAEGLEYGPLAAEYAKARSTAKAAAIEAMNQVGSRENGLIAFRVAEWVMLNFMLTHAGSLLEQTYEIALKDLTDRDLESNPLQSIAAWHDHRIAHVDHSFSKAPAFLAALLSVFDAIAQSK
jgi:hypothetical protein